jgi:tetratricopeptide (TPR) repeat protein/tRNA A-37 threonylcarbamoyl transferase component Bud32
MTHQPDDEDDAPEDQSVARSEGFFDRDTHAVTQTRVGTVRPAPAVFQPGQVVAERYEIVRFIAQGGMGEVYAAKDRKLQGTVALKTIRTDVAKRGRALDRFLREVHIARRVTHPNVCRIFDVDEHHWPAPEGPLEAPPPVTFLTMELLGGETLGDRLERGRLERAEAQEVISQVAAGLDAAHALGIVHRDFKSPNVMLVPPAGPRSATRVVITDFGLARGVEGDNPLASISETGLVVGTAAYMAPEQVEGKEVTAAADIYSLGIVIFEMVTGQRPFQGTSAMSVAVKRLQEPPPSPGRYVADLDPLWEAAILRCLERDPADRFASAADLVQAMGGVEVAAGSGTATLRRMRTRRNRTLYTGLSALVLLVGGAALFWSRATRKPPPMPAATPVAAESPVTAVSRSPRRAIALLSVSNATARPAAAWLATAIPEMLATELGAGEGLRLVPANEVVRARKELGIGEDLARVPALTLARLGRNLGAELLGFGSYALVGAGETALLRVDLRIVTAASGEIVASTSSTGTESQIFDLVSRAGAALREKLGLPAVSAAQALQVEASLPANREAARLYAEGLAHLRGGDAVAARDALEKAVAAEPRHPLPHAALAQAWSALGYEGKALSEAKQAAATSATVALSAEQSALIEVRLHETGKDWTKAAASYKSLAAQFPDNLDYGLGLAAAQIAAGRSKEALAGIDALRIRAGPAGDPRLDLAEARVQTALGNNEAARAAAGRAAATGQAQQMRLVEAQARLRESMALQALGDTKGARTAAESARGLAEAAGDPNGTARALEQTARVLEQTGDLDGAGRLFGRALAAHRAIGNLSSVARVLEANARLLRKQGRPRESEALYEEALATFRKIGAKYEAAATLNDLGAKLQIEGNLAGAQKRYQESLALFAEVGDKAGLAATLTNLGEVLFTRGELPESQEMHQESLATNRESGDKAAQGYDLYRLGEVFSARGDLEVARQKYGEAITLLQESGDRLTAAEANLGLARLDLALGKAASAESITRTSEEVFRAEGAIDRQAAAQVLLADALLAQKRTAEAKAAAEQAQMLAEKSRERRARWGAVRAAARVRASLSSSADRAAAVLALDEAAAEAQKAGYFGVKLELLLAAGQVEAAGHVPTARARLAAVAKEATTKGFLLIARQAGS